MFTYIDKSLYLDNKIESKNYKGLYLQSNQLLLRCQTAREIDPIIYLEILSIAFLAASLMGAKFNWSCLMEDLIALV